MPNLFQHLTNITNLYFENFNIFSLINIRFRNKVRNDEHTQTQKKMPKYMQMTKKIPAISVCLPRVFYILRESLKNMFCVIIGLDPIIYFIILKLFIDCRVKHGNDIFDFLEMPLRKCKKQNLCLYRHN